MLAASDRPHRAREPQHSEPGDFRQRWSRVPGRIGHLACRQQACGEASTCPRVCAHTRPPSKMLRRRRPLEAWKAPGSAQRTRPSIPPDSFAQVHMTKVCLSKTRCARMHPFGMEGTEGMLSASWQSPSLKLGSQFSVSEADAAVVLSRKRQRRDATDSWRRAIFTTLPALHEQAQQEVILWPFRRHFHPAQIGPARYAET